MKRFVLFCSLALLTAKAPGIEYLTPDLIDFGRVREGAIVEGIIRFVNNDAETVTIKKVKTGCGCTVAHITRKTIAPGDTAAVPFTLNTKNFNGTIRKIITLQFQAPVPDKSLYIQSDVYSDVTLKPKYVHLPAVTLNPDTVIVRTLILSNTSGKTLHLKRIVANNDIVKVSPEAAQIPDGGEQHIKVKLTPAKAGRFTYYIRIETNHPTKTTLNVPVFAYIKE